MKLAELEEYLKSKGSFTVAEVQVNFNEKYSTVRHAFSMLEAVRKIKLESGVTFVWIGKEAQEQEADAKSKNDEEATSREELIAKRRKELMEQMDKFKQEHQEQTDADDGDDDDDGDLDDAELMSALEDLFGDDDEDEWKKPTPQPVEGQPDPLCRRALRFWLQKQGGRASIASLQRNLGIGFNRSGRIMDYLQKQGYVEERKPTDPTAKPLMVLVTLEDLPKLFPELPD